MDTSIVLMLLFFFLASMVPVVALIPLLRNWGVRNGALDLTGERKIHNHNMVRIGGIAFIFTFYFMIAVVFF
jgi:UDP-N-acetylmuramyl pentapeptide phosphotransferase/UDP-N-acetylglucosamine-1-phosphate transferase